MEEKTINVFLASPGELKDERKSFRSFVSEIDETFQRMGRPLKTRMWEGLDASYKGHPEQDEYDKLIRASDMFLALFHTIGGEFTIHEFNVALEKFNQTKQTPKIYVYKKALQEGEKIKTELEDFQKRLEDMGLYWTTYSTQDSLHLHFLQQLLIVYADGLSNLKVEDGTVKLWDMDVAKMSNLPFAADNKDYNQLKEELEKLPNEIEKARKRSEKYPDDEDLRDELQEKLNRYNNKKEEFARLQRALFETSQRIATMQRENLSDKLHHAKEAFESGNLDGANALLDEIVNETELCYKNLKQIHESIYQGIDALLLRAKTKMAEVNIPIKERIEEVHAIYVKADQWAKDSALPEDKLDGLLKDYSQFLFDYGKYKEDEQVLLRLVFLREKMLGKEHPNTATSYNNIGTTYHYLGNHPKALEYYFKDLAISEKVLGKEHPSTATSYNNIGGVYKSQGDYTKALEYLQKALDIDEKVLGKEHPETATDYNNIGMTYDNLGDFTKAIEYYQKALDIVKKVLGEEHPYTATTYNNIGGVYYSQRDYTNALEYLQKALAIFKKVLGSNHPDTKATKRNMEICQSKSK
jgi:tetratricopeptide (TPR) repeat protein